MRTQGVYLAGLGIYLPPPESVASAVAGSRVPASRADGYGITGVAVAGQISAPEMALLAAEEALKNSGLSEDIGLLLCAHVWHQGPDGWSTAYYLQRHLLGDDLLGVEIQHGCSGMFSAMELAVMYLKAAPDGRAALVAAGDNFGTQLIDRWDQGDGIAYLGDAASAAVLSTASGWAELLALCTGTFSEMEEAHRAGEPLFPPGATIGAKLDYGARAGAFQRQAIEDDQWIRLLLGHQEHSISCVRRALREAGVEAADISRVIIHGMPRQTAASYLKVLGFSLDQSTWEFGRTVGHLGASDHLAALHHLLATSQVEAGDTLLLCGFSPGMTYKAAVIRISNPRPFHAKTKG